MEGEREREGGRTCVCTVSSKESTVVAALSVALWGPETGSNANGEQEKQAVAEGGEGERGATIAPRVRFSAPGLPR